MYDVEKLVSIVCDYLDAEADYMKYSLDARKELGLAPGSTLWIPSLNGSKAYRLGELSEKSGATGSILADICAMLNINQELLVAAVKSMQRKERHNGRWDNPNYTCWMNEDDKSGWPGSFPMSAASPAFIPGLAVPDGKSLGVNKVELNRRGRAKSPSFFILRLANLPFFL